MHRSGFAPALQVAMSRPAHGVVAVQAAQCCIGPFKFPSKAAAKAHVKQLLKDTPSGTIISRMSEEGRLLSFLLQRHPHGKIGCGVSYFSTISTTMDIMGMHIPTKHFVLHRPDGSSTDFSYKKCFDSKIQVTDDTPLLKHVIDKPESCRDDTWTLCNRSSNCSEDLSSTSTGSSGSTAAGSGTVQQQQQQQPLLQSTERLLTLPAAYIYHALRIAVAPQILAFKRAVFHQGLAPDTSAMPSDACSSGSGSSRSRSSSSTSAAAPLCPLSGEPLSPGNSEVDHSEPSFVQLVQQWLSRERLTLQQVQLAVGDNSLGPHMACRRQQRAWQQYHQQHAVLRVLSHQVHRQISGRKANAGRSASPADSSSSSSSSGGGITSATTEVNAESSSRNGNSDCISSSSSSSSNSKAVPDLACTIEDISVQARRRRRKSGKM